MEFNCTVSRDFKRSTCIRTSVDGRGSGTRTDSHKGQSKEVIHTNLAMFPFRSSASFSAGLDRFPYRSKERGGYSIHFNLIGNVHLVFTCHSCWWRQEETTLIFQISSSYFSEGDRAQILTSFIEQVSDVGFQERGVQMQNCSVSKSFLEVLPYH